MPTTGSLVLKLYAPFASVVVVVTFVHEPVELFWRVIVAPAIGLPFASVSVPLMMKFWLTTAEVRLAAAESCVSMVVTCTVTTLLVALA